jgi:hypothetical protein
VRRAGREIRANNVVVEHRADRVAILPQVFEQPRSAEPSLFLAGNGCKHQRGAITQDKLREAPPHL